MLLVIFAAIGCVSMSHGFLFGGNKRFPPWDKLTVTFPKYSSVPQTEADAKDDKWTMIDDGCAGNKFFVGKRYAQDGDGTLILLFTKKGDLAGIQIEIPSTSPLPLLTKSPFLKIGNKFYLTAYFMDVEKICSDLAVDGKYVGDKLLLQTRADRKNMMSMPLNQSDIGGTGWVEGKCFWGMGKHYWYKISKNMNCDDFFPVFLLYNNGVLNGFGWVLQRVNLDSKRMEHPGNSVLKLFFNKDTEPACVYDFDIRSTQHIYLESWALTNRC